MTKDEILKRLKLIIAETEDIPELGENDNPLPDWKKEALRRDELITRLYLQLDDMKQELVIAKQGA